MGELNLEGGGLQVVPCLQAHDEVEDSGKLRPVVPEKRLVHSHRKIIHMLLLCLQASKEIKVTIKPCGALDSMRCEMHVILAPQGSHPRTKKHNWMTRQQGYRVQDFSLDPQHYHRT